MVTIQWRWYGWENVSLMAYYIVCEYCIEYISIVNVLAYIQKNSIIHAISFEYEYQ